MTQTPGNESAKRWQSLAAWVSVDNVSLFVGLALVTAGAAMWSARAALLTCGGLLIAGTLLRLVLDRRGAE